MGRSIDDLAIVCQGWMILEDDFPPPGTWQKTQLLYMSGLSEVQIWTSFNDEWPKTTFPNLIPSSLAHTWPFRIFKFVPLPEVFCNFAFTP